MQIINKQERFKIASEILRLPFRSILERKGFYYMERLAYDSIIERAKSIQIDYEKEMSERGVFIIVGNEFVKYYI